MPVRPAGLRGPRESGAMFRILALVSTPVAVFAVIIAVIALVQAQSAKNRANNLASGGQPPGATTPGREGVATEPPADPRNSLTEAPQPTSTPVDVLNPQATYTQHYSDQTLNPQANGYNSAYIDLDEPRVAASSEKYDIVLDGSNATPHLTFRDGVSAALASGANLQPRDCAELIRTGPLPEDSEVAAQRGTVLCLATSAQSARDQGIRQRMVVLRITDLSATGKVTMSLTAWEVPNN